MPEEVNQEEDAETEDKQNGNIDMGHLTSTGRVKIVPDIPISEPDTASWVLQGMKIHRSKRMPDQL